MRRLSAVVVALSLSFASAAFAELMIAELDSESIKNVEGLAVYAGQQADGAIAFVVVRDPSKLHTPEGNGQLELLDDAGVALRCAIHGVEQNGKVEYSFAVAPRHVDRATFTLFASDDSTAGVKSLGGGTAYRLPLGKFDEPIEIACPAGPAPAKE